MPENVTVSLDSESFEVLIYFSKYKGNIEVKKLT